jgi:peroxiredoxin
LRSFQERLADFNARGIRLVAISVDPVETNAQHVRRIGCTFTFLSDPKAEAIRAYDLLHAHGGPKGSDISRPGEFLVDAGGIVRWLNLTESIAVRARPGQVLTAIEGMSGRIAP